MDGLGLTSPFICPGGLALDTGGYLLGIDKCRKCIRSVKTVEGCVTTVAGNGMDDADFTDGEPHTFFTYGHRCGCIHKILVADTHNNSIQMIDHTPGKVDGTA